MKFTAITMLVATAAAADNSTLGAPQMSSTSFTSDKSYNSTKTWTKEDSQNKIKEMRKKFTDYFEYAMEAKGVADTTQVPTCSTSQECADGGMMTKCCVTTVLHHKASGTKDAMYRCMTKAVAEANIDFQRADFSVNMKCLGKDAAAMIGASIATIAAFTLYWEQPS